MRKMLVLAGKELRSSFVTPLAYVAITCFMFLGGVFFFSLLQQYNNGLLHGMFGSHSAPNLNEWVILPYYRSLYYVLVFIVPILSMRAFAEERRLGTFELLITSPVSVAEIVWGKFIGLGIVSFCMLLASFVFPSLLIFFSNPEVPPILIGFVGLNLFALAAVAIGIGISACSRNQVVAGIVCLVVFLMLIILDSQAQAIGFRFARIGNIVAEIIKGEPIVGLQRYFEDAVAYCSPASHLEPMLRGVFESSALVYFISLTLLGLFLASRALDAARWR